MESNEFVATPLHASFFSGIEGFDLAAEWMGWETALTCEIGNFQNEIIKKRFPNAKHYENIKDFNGLEWRGKIFLLTGGFPCQPFSVAGSRTGADDDRYLWPELCRVIDEIRPTWVIGENVDGILSMVQPGTPLEVGGQTTLFGQGDTIYEEQQQYITGIISSDLERIGYDIQPLLIPAAAVGAKHRRNRVWFVGHAKHDGLPTSAGTRRL
ncbi:MAG: DNA cytosine methyltransferase [Mangrovibacterium sp.]